MNMRNIALLVATLMALSSANAGVSVFACEPEWGALVTTIAGDQANVTVATTALQDVHQIQARPSLISGIRKAQLLICSGAGLEAGWLPLLLRQAGNGGIQEGQPGNLMAASYVKALDVPKVLDRSQGDLHAEGNPHIITDPRNLRLVARVLTDRLKLLDQANAARYEASFASFNEQLSARIEAWQQQAAPLRGAPIVIQHNVWVYLTSWLGLRVVAALEPKPGVPPTSSHLAGVLTKLESTPAKAIVVAAYEDPKAAQWLAGKTGLPVITLPYSVGGNKNAEDLLSLYDTTITQLLQGVE
ncbi:MAG: zinc ABC transporter substrate-binding protein [Gammaproteobacteria bacterium]